MIIFLSGNNYRKINENFLKIKNDFFQKQPFLSYEKIDNESYRLKNINHLFNKSGLFYSKGVFYFHNSLKEIKDLEKYLTKNIKEFQKNENIFIFSEEQEEVEVFEKLKPYCQIYKIFLDKKEKPKSLFSLSDLFWQNNKDQLWLEYLNFKNKKTPSESILGILVWAAKILFIIYNKKDYKLNPFIEKKAQKSLNNFHKNINANYFKLLDIQNSSRENSLDLELEIEKFILQL